MAADKQGTSRNISIEHAEPTDRMTPGAGNPAFAQSRIIGDRLMRDVGDLFNDFFPAGPDCSIELLFRSMEPSSTKDFRRALAACRSGEQASTLTTVRMTDLGGDTRFVELSLLIEGGRPAEIQLFAYDVTEHVARTEQLRQLLDGSAEALVVHRGAEPLYMNDALAEMVGYSLEELRSAKKKISEFIHPDDLPEVAGNIAARLQGKPAPRDYEFRLRRRNGHEIWVNCRASTVVWDGAPAVLAACFDITEHKISEEKRLESMKLFETMFELCPDFLSIARLEDGVMRWVNNSFAQQFGYTREEMIGNSARELNLWDSWETRETLISRLEDEGIVTGLEVRGRRKSGEMFTGLVSATQMRFGGEDLLLIVGQDISERMEQRRELKESKEAAEFANRTKSEFLANMSHELRTPLNAILGFSETISNEIFGPVGNEKYQAYAADIHSSGTHLLEIINDILDLSKVEAGKLDLEFEEINFNEAVEHCVRIVRDRAYQAGLTVETHLPDVDVLMKADRRRIKQIVINLLSNAIKFTPKGGEILVAGSFDDSQNFNLRVKDSGVGMTRNGVEQALKPFGQINSHMTRDHDGAGLGLPLVVAFADLHGAVVDIDSAPGEGTEVTLRFGHHLVSTA